MSMDRSLTRNTGPVTGSNATSRQAATLQRKRARRRSKGESSLFDVNYWNNLTHSKERADILAKYASMNIPGTWRR